MTLASSKERWHALDALRAAAMLLGLFMHATHSFEMEFWTGINDCSSTPEVGFFLQQIFAFFHYFRMHAFFLVAGFFAHLLYNRGWVAMLKNRAARILLPFLFGMMVLVPSIQAIRLFGELRAVSPVAGIPWRQIGRHFASGDFSQHYSPHYLWFLGYLLLYYPAFLLGRWWLRQLGLLAASRGHADRAMSWLCQSKWAGVWLMGPTLLIFLFIRSPILDPIVGETGERLAPQPALLLFYGLFFTFGWLLSRQPELLSVLGRHWRRFFTSAIVVYGITTLFAVMMFLGMRADGQKPPPPMSGPAIKDGAITFMTHSITEETALNPAHKASFAAFQTSPPRPLNPDRPDRPGALQPPPLPPPHVVLVMRLINAFLSWSLTLGVTGFFVRYANRPNRCFRYFADASYWLYLAHVPVLMLIQIWIAYWPLPWWLKLMLLNLFLLVPLLLAYDLLVRNTWIGAALNGRRYPSAIPLLMNRIKEWSRRRPK